MHTYMPQLEWYFCFFVFRAERVEDKGDVWNRSWVQRLDKFRNNMATTTTTTTKSYQSSPYPEKSFHGDDSCHSSNPKSGYPKQRRNQRQQQQQQQQQQQLSRVDEFEMSDLKMKQQQPNGLVKQQQEESFISDSEGKKRPSTKKRPKVVKESEHKTRKTFSQSKGCSGFKDILFSVTKIIFLASFIVAFAVHSIAVWMTPEDEVIIEFRFALSMNMVCTTYGLITVSIFRIPSCSGCRSRPSSPAQC